VRAWFMASLLTCVSCSDGGVRTGSLPEPADFLPMVAESVEADTLGDEQPRLLLRCEQGQLNAYVVVGPPDAGDSSQTVEHAVAVRLDSAPSC
jgi:hypothetical protein